MDGDEKNSNYAGNTKPSGPEGLEIIRKGSVKSIKERLKMQVTQRGWSEKMLKSKMGIALPILGEVPTGKTEESTCKLSEKKSANQPGDEDSTSLEPSGKGIAASECGVEKRTSPVTSNEDNIPMEFSSKDVAASTVEDNTPPATSTILESSIEDRAALTQRPSSGIPLSPEQDKFPKLVMSEDDLPAQNEQDDSPALTGKRGKCEEEKEHLSSQGGIHCLESSFKDLLARVEKQQNQLGEMSEMLLGLIKLLKEHTDIVKLMPEAFDTINIRIKKLEENECRHFPPKS